MNLSIAGQHTQQVTVSVCARDVVQELHNNWLRAVGTPGMYIENNKWTYWQDTGHGSGDTEIVRPATEEEIEIAHAFSVIMRKVVDTNV